MKRSVLLSAAALAACLSAGVAAAQDSLADQKLRLEVAQAEFNLRKAQTDAQLAALKALGDSRGDTASVSAGQDTAEALLLREHLYAAAANALAERLRPGTPPPEIVFGTQVPDVAEWQALERTVASVQGELDTATRKWSEATSSTSRLGRSNLMSDPLTLSVAATAITALVSIADMFSVDSTIGGAAASASNEQLDLHIIRALRTRGLAADDGEFRRSNGTPKVNEKLKPLQGPYELAKRQYVEGYLIKVAEKRGKAEELDPEVQVAGRLLESAIANYEALQKALYVPVDGVPPAVAIERQAVRAAEAQSTILYVVAHRGAITTTTKSGALVGRGVTPAYLKGAYSIDYAMVEGTGFRTGTVVCTTATLPLTSIGFELTAPKARRGQPAPQAITCKTTEASQPAKGMSAAAP